MGIVTLRYRDKNIATVDESITTLKLAQHDIERASEIDGIESLVNLQWLDLGWNKIEEIDGLDSLMKLKKLDLSGNRIARIEGLDTLVGLHELNLSKNKIAVIKGLEGLVALKSLDLRANQITTIKNLGTLVNLRVLRLEDNPIEPVPELDLENVASVVKHCQCLLSRGIEGLEGELLDRYKDLVEITDNIEISKLASYLGIEESDTLKLVVAWRYHVHVRIDGAMLRFPRE